VRGMAVIGNLTRDIVDGGTPRVGGAPYHAARALRLLGGRTRVLARCAEGDRRTLLPPLVALGVPVVWRAAPRTATFSLRYDGEERTLELDDPGTPWTLTDVGAVGRTEWIQLGGLTRADFPAELLGSLARDRRLALDGQALVRPERTGKVILDDAFDPAVLGHLTVLKLAQEEVEALGGEEVAESLEIPELLLTYGSNGAVLVTRGRRERITVRKIETPNPTGAGDAFLAGYVWARAAGHRPQSAARSAGTVASRVLELDS
jgi:sugar/nucleoside kinase (ribokinase family)